jgi:lambda repressor-like predicted transcriptional regulator
MSKRSNYNPEAIEVKLQEMQSDGTCLKVVAKKYGVSRSSLQFKIKNPCYKNTCGPSPVLSDEEESTLVR